MADLLADIGSLLGASGTGNIAKNSTSRPNNTELNMDDFLQLMIVQLSNQTIDDTMDTSEMMNQMLQMQMITAMSNMTDISVQSYANSLVGKVVTVGILQDNVLEEREIVVKGVGTYNGQQVVFGHDGNMYFLSQIMAVGRLPDGDGHYTDEASYGYDMDGDGEDDTTIYVGKDGKPGSADDWYYKDVDGDGKDEKVFVGPDGVPGTEDDWYDSKGGEDVGGAEGNGGNEESDDTQTGSAAENPEYDGTQGADTDD